ncbi:undecaprenyldiphospho-muramoylpentapeptide beta-N-acetylglucosaminyltransferase [Dysgonomonas sp. 216]|uniref:undecaprenyldiphospho-muramoylpentapeptide beta-N-acetylglucosaminyltransferase n=1 Tax=Dysgonomonas sp. 216 TaxID=2302934 RepID=UPI0013D20D73|nr:undecaprenyldiphospho-muramoylpentapeptide beta-N-acetylglucosaminyltransferase [Dysgonomonas sp. 216]NDW18163.1 undecaprenyldiphospho-muramoylpentapeptide beta-N-acetylglucosaminyltransferase [Dysgonomonas sp. 216]
MEKLRVIISGGGTGGHIFPAIAIADALKKENPATEILFVGAEKRMEMSRVPAAGYEIIGLPVSGFNRRSLLKNFSVLLKLLKSLRIARKVLKDFKPHIAIGVGGYASGPLLRVATSMGIPTLIQEQNSYPGVTNKLLAKKASKICVAYEGMEKFFPADKIILTGNPCRQTLLDDVSKDEAIEFFQLDPNLKTILIIGGSLGALTINRSVQSSLKEIGDSDVQIIWQAGSLYFSELYLELPNREGTARIHLYPFLDRMDLAYKAADLVISRAGASSISELSLLGKPTILVPSPNVAEDHQTKNAMALVNKNAAILVHDKEAESTLISKALELIKDESKLAELSINISKLAQRDSADRIADEIMKLVMKKMKKI